MTAEREKRYTPEHPLLFDGAMGTYYSALPGRALERCELANLTHPEEILAIHRAYLDAGCKAVKTNTFTVSADYAVGEDALAERLIDAGSLLAREAAAPFGADVFADIGPVSDGARLTPGEIYVRQARRFLACGVTHFLAETLASDDGIRELADFLRESCPGAFLLVSYAVGADGMTREGNPGRALFRRTAALPGVDAVGFNCMSGPSHLLEFIRTLEHADTILSVMPNAGYPTVLGRRTVYQGQPAYFGRKLLEIIQAGAGIVGGCCGTTPAHIARTAEALAGGYSLQPGAGGRIRAEKPRAASENFLWKKLESGRRVIAVELDPPANDDISGFLADARILQAAGADILTIADCPVGRPRADSSLLACRVRRELGMETLPHMTCRDRNLNAIKALLLGLSMEEIHSVLLVTGDPIPSESRDEVKSVFNFNSRKLARYISVLDRETLLTPFRLFGALNLNAANFDMQLQLAREKEASGISGFLTQPVLSPEALENLKLARAALRGKLLGGIFPVVSARNAVFLNNEVTGMRVCDEIIALYEGRDRAEGEEIAVELSLRIARDMAPFTDGYYLMTPFRRVGLMERILRSLAE